MARTLKQDIEAYVGPIDGLVLETNQWLTAGAAQLVDLIPPDRAEQYATSTPFSGTPLGCSIANQRLLAVQIGGRPARHVGYSTYFQSLVTGSLHSLDSTDPGYYMMNTKVYTIPVSVSGFVVTIDYPILTSQDVSINLPPEFKQPIILYASIQYLINQVKTLRATIPDNVDTTNDLTLAWSTFLTLLDTEEDIELANAKLQEFQMRLQEMEVENKNVIQEMTANVQATLHRINGVKEHLAVLQSQYADALSLFIKVHYPTASKE
jgi:hypothetical protein